MVKILQITATQMASQNGQQVSVIFGLGDDQRTYFWNAKLCGWQGNWDAETLAAIESADKRAAEKLAASPQDNRKTRRAKKAGR